jgi:hypothetical protein
VRPRVFEATGTSAFPDVIPTFDEHCVPILKNYELVSSELLRKLTAAEKQISSVPKLVRTQPSFHLMGSLLQCISLLCTDITLSTVSKRDRRRDDSSEENKNDAKNHFRRNEGLPTLLRILGNAIETLQLLTTALPMPIRDDPRNESDCYKSLRLCAVTLLAFDVLQGDGDEDCSFADPGQSMSAMFLPHKLSPLLVVSRNSRSRDLTLVRRILKKYEISTIDSSSHSSTTCTIRKDLERALGTDTCSYDDIDDDYWKSLPFSTKGWIDSDPKNAGATQRLVSGLWCSIASLLTSSSKIGLMTEERREYKDENYQEQRDFVLKKLGGPAPFLRDVRAHFFGRNFHGIEDLAKREGKGNDDGADDMGLSTVVIKMGRRVLRTHKNSNNDGTHVDGPIHERVPSMTVAAVNAFRILLVPAMIDDIDNTCRQSVLENIFPICAALLDSKNAFFGSLGAAGLLRASEVLAPRRMDPESTDFVPDQIVLQKRCNAEADGAWTNFIENALTVLEQALQSSSDRGHVVVAIGRAQSRLFEAILLGGEENKNDDRFRRRRMSVTEQWLLILERSLYHPSTETQQLELLLGGVIPLLSQHAVDERSDADGMEFGRLGLKALLPLTTHNAARVDSSQHFGETNVGKKTQMASMVALINLIFAAYPMMASHGGKIMSHMLTAAASATPPINECEKEEGIIKEKPPKNDSIKNLAILIAAIVLVVCEPNFAPHLLESIENNRGQYQENLLSVVAEVRELAAGLKAIS